MADPVGAVVAWYRAEYRRRTEAVEAGQGELDWILPGYRVRWSEIVTEAQKQGITGNAELLDLRLALAEVILTPADER